MQNSPQNRIREENADQPKILQAKTVSGTTMSHIGKTRTNSSTRVDRSKDKELINSGLHRLISSFNTAHKVNQKPSKLCSLYRPNKQHGAESSNTDEQALSHIVLNKQMSTDKYTMTDFRKEDGRKVDLELTALSENPGEGRDLQWTDPRLLKKYSLVKQPTKKALTVPYVNKSDQNTDITEVSEDDLPDVIYSEDKHFLFKCLYYIATTSVSFVGSMCGITLITLVFWKVLDENVLSYVSLAAPKNDVFNKGPITSVVWSVMRILNTVFGKIVRLLTISTNEVFVTEEEEHISWYRNYIRY